MELKSKEFQTNQTVLSDPLFSSIITLYILILLYFPTLFLKIIFSPVLISTGILLLSLFRLGTIQKTQEELSFSQPPQLEQQTHDPNDENHIRDSCDTNSVIDSGTGYDRNPFYADSFVEYWDVRAPLEIIYEAYEGEEEEDDDGNGDGSNEKCVLGIERYPSLSKYYPESDTDSSSGGDFAVIGDWDSPERMGFRWEDEDREGLIEIALDGKRRNQFFNVEEDNLIEIDISPVRNDEFSEESWVQLTSINQKIR